jgi:hypothetical protein
MSILEVHRIEDEGIEVQVLTGETNQEGDGTSEVALKAL